MSAAEIREYEQIVRRAAARLEVQISARYGATWSLVLVRADPLEWSAVWTLGSAGASSPDNVVQFSLRLDTPDTTTTTGARERDLDERVDLVDPLAARDEVMVDMLSQIVEALDQPATRERALARTRAEEALHWLQAHRRKAGAT